MRALRRAQSAPLTRLSLLLWYGTLLAAVLGGWIIFNHPGLSALTWVLGVALVSAEVFAHLAFWYESRLQQQRLYRYACSSEEPVVLLLFSFSRSDSWRSPKTGATNLSALAAAAGAVGIPIAFFDPSVADTKSSSPTFCSISPHQFLTMPISSDERWTEAFRCAASGAAAIILVPGPSSGILHEAKHLVSGGLLAKTLLFVPQLDWGLGSREAWDETRRIWKTEGFDLPPSERNGWLYAPQRDLSPS